MILSESHIRRIIREEVANAMASNPTTFDVKESFNKINQAFFGGSLPPCPINMKLKKGYLGFFKYDGMQGGHLINPILSVNGMYQLNSNQLDSIVGHEMIHYCLALRGVDPKCSHGSAFKQMASDMNAKLGLNIDERVDTGAMQYGMGQGNSGQPSQALLAFMQSYMQSFNGYAQQMKGSMGSMQGTSGLFMNNLYTFTIALVNALKRCISHKMLNENGIPMPQMVYDFMNGYDKWSRATKNFFYDIMRYREGYGSGRNYYNGNGGLAVNNNTTLGELIYDVFPSIQKEYEKANQQSANALSSMTCVTNTIDGVTQLKQRIDTEIQYLQRNAQAQPS